MAQPTGTAGPSAPPSWPSKCIVDPRFCCQYTVELAIVRKVMKLTCGNFVITDVNGNLLFKVKERVFGLHDKRTLLDGSGSPVLTLKDKMMSMHNRWRVFRGGSTKKSDLMYTVKKSSMFQFETKLYVFLSHNEEEKICDFRVECDESDDWIVYAGGSDVILAQMDKKKHTVRSVLFGQDKFLVTVKPNIDYAFIASLLVILDDVNGQDPNVMGILTTFVLQN